MQGPGRYLYMVWSPTATQFDLCEVEAGNGVQETVECVSGTASAHVVRPTNIIPAAYTICSATRYTMGLYSSVLRGSKKCYQTHGRGSAEYVWGNNQALLDVDTQY